MSSNKTFDKKVDIKLEKLTDNGAGGNNFRSCKIKWRSKLDAYNLWKYVKGPRPEIVELQEDKVITGRVQSGEEGEVAELRTFVVAGNRERYEALQKENGPGWRVTHALFPLSLMPSLTTSYILLRTSGMPQTLGKPFKTNISL
jgi:hypothetical protein